MGENPRLPDYFVLVSRNRSHSLAVNNYHLARIFTRYNSLRILGRHSEILMQGMFSNLVVRPDHQQAGTSLRSTWQKWSSENGITNGPLHGPHRIILHRKGW